MFNSRASSSTSSSSKNKGLVAISDIENHLQNWTIPKTSPYNVYNRDLFRFKSSYLIKTVEESLPISSEHSTFELLSRSIIEEASQKGYKYLHIGLVQVAVKPLTRTGLNTSLLLALRDKRHRKFEDSLLGCLTTSLSEGPVYFQSFPNFSLSLFDPNLLKALTLNIQTAGFNMDPRSHNVCLIYRIFFKVMNTVTPDLKLSTHYLKDKKGETTVFQVNPLKANLNVPRTLKWDEITVPSVWKLEDEVPKHVPQKELQNIVEHPDGSVEILFGTKMIRLNPSIKQEDQLERSRSFRAPTAPSDSGVSSRRSFSFVEQVVNTNQVSQPQFKVEDPSTSRPFLRRPSSPTESDMAFSTTGDLYVLTTPEWTPDKKLLKALS